MRHAALALMILTLATPIAQSDVEETRTTLRQHVLKLINRDRALYNLPPVELDPQASLNADEYCREQIRNGTTGHFTTDGRTPYMRYSFAGGNDGVSENAAAWSANYTFNERALYEMSRRSQDAMMAEMAPKDGHKRTILDPHATHVGIGLAWEKGEFRLVHEFIRRYVAFTTPLPREAGVGEEVMVSVKPLHGTAIEAITVHHEKLPAAMSAVTANNIDSYSLPDKRRDYLPRVPDQMKRRADGSVQIIRHEYAGGRRGDFTLRKDGSFAFAVPLIDGPGIYTVVVWVSKDGMPVAASNVSIRAEERLQSTARVSAGR